VSNQSDVIAQLQVAMQRIEQIRDADPAKAVRLGGLTNLNFRVQSSSGTYVLRIPGAGTNEFIDRRGEEIAARSAAAAGVNCEVVFFDSSDGLMLTKFVEGAETMSPKAFENLEAIERAGKVIRQLHTQATPFAIKFLLFPVIDDYKNIIQRRQAPMPIGFNESEKLIAKTRASLEQANVNLVPSHCDPLCENFLDTGSRMYLIDFEYAGNNDPMWDLGDLSVEGNFTETQDQALLRGYFNGPTSDSNIGRMIAYKSMCDVLWALWGQVQFLNNNPVEDFEQYANNRMGRAIKLMESPSYLTHLQAIAL
jgi:thiamine kinase-like enzyme